MDTEAKQISRRKFLKIAGIGMGAALVSCVGLGYAGTRTPAVDTPSEDLGSQNNGQRVLVAYATRAGSTVEVAVTIGQALAVRGYRVDVRPLKDDPALDGYDAVVLGSAIRMGSWVRESVDYVKEHAAVLSALPTAFFSVHLNNLGDDEASRATRLTYLDAVRPLVKPAYEGAFAGAMDKSKLSFLDRTMANSMDAKDEDLRDWDAMRAWSDKLFI